MRLVEPPAAVARVRVLGRVVAGQPEASVEVPDGEIAVPAEWLGRGRFFALCVAGESMKNAAIINGDTVVVREQSTAADGEIVVATVAGETTVKRLHIAAHGVRLVPENPTLAPIEVGEGEVTIHGVVVGVMRCIAIKSVTKTMKTRYSRACPPLKVRHG